MSGERDLRVRHEDAQAVIRAGIGRRQHECGFHDIEPARHALHLRGSQVRGGEHDAERIAAAGVAGERSQERAQRVQGGSRIEGRLGLSRAPAATRGGREHALMAEDNDDFFQRLSSHWKRNYPGWTAWLLTPDRDLPRRMRLRESRKIPMWNGPIECRLFRFDLVAGAMQPRSAPPAEPGA